MASGWKRRFDDPIPLPRGRQLVTLEDAAKYIQKLPAAEQQIAEWPRSKPCCWSLSTPPHDDGTHRRHEGFEPARGSGV
jgi:hypothetical protein